MNEKEVTRLLEEADVMSTDEVIDPSKLNLSEQVIQLNRVAKVVKGGRRFSFSALVVVGDGDGHVGIGFGKANEVPDAIQKAVQNGRKNLMFVPRVGRTIPYAIVGEYGAARVMLRPASEGTGIIAGPAVRAVLELAGLRDVLTKNLGTSNAVNILKATIQGLQSLRDGEEVARLRGKNLDDMVGARRAALLREFSKIQAPPAPLTTDQPQLEAPLADQEAQMVVVADEDQPAGADTAPAGDEGTTNPEPES